MLRFSVLEEVRSSAKRLDLRDLLATRLPTRRALFALAPFSIVVVLFFLRLGHRELTSSHEARAAQNAQRMIDTGEWGLPILFDGRVDLQKPPGYYWVVAAIGMLNAGQVDEWVARLPAAIAGLVCCLSVYLFMRSDRRGVAAIVAMLALATANHYTGISRTARIDVPLTCAVAISLLAFYRGCRRGQCDPPSAVPIRALAWHLLAAVAAAVALLLKGPVGAALIGPTAILWLISERLFQPAGARPRLPLASWLLIPATVAAIALPWFVWANTVTGGEFIRVFFWHHTIDRYMGSSPLLASHPWWYYLPRFFNDFMPWTPLLNCLSIWCLRTGRFRFDPIFRFALIGFVAIFTVLSTAQFKRADYLLPAYPFAAMMLGCAAERWIGSRVNSRTVTAGKWVFGSGVVIGVACWLAMLGAIEPAEQQKEEKRRFAEMIRSHAPAPNVILQFRMESHLLTFHLGRPVYTFVEWAELNELLAAPGPHYVVMPPEYVYAASEIVKSRKLVPIARLEDYTHGKPLRPLVFLRTAD